MPKLSNDLRKSFAQSGQKQQVIEFLARHRQLQAVELDIERVSRGEAARELMKAARRSPKALTKSTAPALERSSFDNLLSDASQAASRASSAFGQERAERRLTYAKRRIAKARVELASEFCAIGTEIQKAARRPARTGAGDDDIVKVTRNAAGEAVKIERDLGAPLTGGLGILKSKAGAPQGR